MEGPASVQRRAPRDGEACVVALSGALAEGDAIGQTWVLPRDGRIYIGRTRGNEISTSCAAVGRRHATIEGADGRRWLRDLGSTNGTRLGDRHLSLAGADLVDGARFRVGTVLFAYLAGDDVVRSHAALRLLLATHDPDAGALRAGFLTECVERALAERGEAFAPVAVVGITLADSRKLELRDGSAWLSVALGAVGARLEKLMPKAALVGHGGLGRFGAVLRGEGERAVHAVTIAARAAVERESVEVDGTTDALAVTTQSEIRAEALAADEEPRAVARALVLRTCGWGEAALAAPRIASL